RRSSTAYRLRVLCTFHSMRRDSWVGEVWAVLAGEAHLRFSIPNLPLLGWSSRQAPIRVGFALRRAKQRAPQLPRRRRKFSPNARASRLVDPSSTGRGLQTRTGRSESARPESSYRPRVLQAPTGAD